VFYILLLFEGFVSSVAVFFFYFFIENLFWHSYITYMYILYFYFLRHAFCNKPQYHLPYFYVDFWLAVDNTCKFLSSSTHYISS